MGRNFVAQVAHLSTATRFGQVIPHLAQLMQFPGVWLVERYRKRRLISLLSAGASLPPLLLLALAALWPNPQAGLALLLIGLMLR